MSRLIPSFPANLSVLAFVLMMSQQEGLWWKDLHLKWCSPFNDGDHLVRKLTPPHISLVLSLAGKANVCKRERENVTVLDGTCFILKAVGRAHLDLNPEILLARKKERMILGEGSNEWHVSYWVKGRKPSGLGQKLLSRQDFYNKTQY